MRHETDNPCTCCDGTGVIWQGGHDGDDPPWDEPCFHCRGTGEARVIAPPPPPAPTMDARLRHGEAMLAVLKAARRLCECEGYEGAFASRLAQLQAADAKLRLLEEEANP